MIAFMLANWRMLMAAVVASAATWAVTYGVHRVEMVWLRHENELALANQAKTLLAACQKDKQITESTDHDFQDQIAALYNELARVKRLRSATRCIVPTADAAGGADAKAGPRHAAANGVATGALYDYAAEAERYRLQVIGLQDFISKTWAARGL
jgi:hypothetical protein